RRRADVPRPRQAPDARGPGLPDPYGFDVPPHRPEPKRRLRRALTSNITIAAVAIGAVGSAVVLVDVRDFVKDDTKPPKMAAADLSTNDMLAKLTSASDMDPVAADAIAAAKKRAYEEHQRELKRLKEKARREAKARAELKARQERERLARSNPSAVGNEADGESTNAANRGTRCWPSLRILWERRSNWNAWAEIAPSVVYASPQALPGSKRANSGADLRTSSPTQIAWGLGYIKARY